MEQSQLNTNSTLLYHQNKDQISVQLKETNKQIRNKIHKDIDTHTMVDYIRLLKLSWR